MQPGRLRRRITEAAQKGHAIAAYNVGVQFLEGEGVPQDFSKALRWLETAAKMGFVEANINIAYMYLEVRRLFVRPVLFR
jgi:TPR repeat protein